MLGHELPGERDRLGLEVVAEREVAEHLEERGVTGGRADVVEVGVLATGAHHLLRGDDAQRRRRLGAEEPLLHRLHAGDDEQGRRIVGRRNQGRGGTAKVSLRLEVREKALAELGGRTHQAIVPGVRFVHRRVRVRTGHVGIVEVPAVESVVDALDLTRPVVCPATPGAALSRSSRQPRDQAHRYQREPMRRRRRPNGTPPRRLGGGGRVFVRRHRSRSRLRHGRRAWPRVGLRLRVGARLGGRPVGLHRRPAGVAEIVVQVGLAPA